MCFLNKMDRTGANFYRCVDMIKKLLGERMMMMIEMMMEMMIEMMEMMMIMMMVMLVMILCV